MASKKKLLTSAIALGTAAALTLGGTFAWQSISQKALNEASDIVNPGGRLHNDLYYVDAMKTDANIYVENFADDDIYARVRLSEYMEIVMNYGTDVARVETVAGSKTSTDDPNGEQPTQKDTYDFTYEIHKFGDDAENDTDKYFTWATGKADSEDYYYMPTFNKNKDSLKADLHGLYMDRVGGISSRGEDQYTGTPWAEGDTREGFEIYDGDYNTLDELANLSVDDMELLIEGGDKAFRDQEVLKSVKLVDASGDKAHKATKVGTTKGLLSVQEWLDMVDENGYAEEGKLTDDGKTAMYGYWVYDTDGWVYWSAPIAGGETTGLLLDGFTLNEVMDDTWYYAIEAEAQFVTANDVGKADSTGFYTTADSGVATVDDGETETTGPVSEEAETLLKLIGVEFDETTGGEEESGPTLQIEVTNDQTWYFPSENTLGATVNLEVTGATIYDYSKNWGEDGFATEVPDSEFANIQWSVSGNTSESTVLSETTGKTTTLTIGNDETAKIYIYAKLTYNDITGEGCVYIDNEPYVVSSQIYHLNGKVLSGRDYYEAGKANEYELLFFPVYYSAVSDYSREEAHTGKAHEYLAKGTTWALGHIENYQFVEDESLEGVTLTQNESDPAKVTLTIEEGYNSTFALGATDRDGTTYHSVLKPKVASISLSWPEGVTDDSTNVTVNFTGVNSVKPTATYTETAGNEELESRTCYFYAKKVNVTTSGYQVLKDMTEEVWFICVEDIDAEYGWQVDDGDRLIEISEDDGSITVNQELAENINFTYEMHVSCEGYEITRDVSVTANPTDWSSLVTMRMPTSAEYTLLCDATNDDNSVMHWSEISSWTSDKSSEISAVIRGKNSAREEERNQCNENVSNIGFRPAFEVTDKSSCEHLNVGDVVAIGTLYDGTSAYKIPANPVLSGGDMKMHSAQCEEKLTIRTAIEDEGYLLKAVYVGDGVFVCDRNVCVWFTWYQLRDALATDATE